MTEGERIVDLFLVKLTKDTKDSLAAKEKAKAQKYGKPWNGNSRLWGTIKARRVVIGDKVAYRLVMEDYSYYVDAGRQPEPVSKKAGIEDWIKRKGLNPVKVISEMREKAREGKKKRVDKLKRPTFEKATKQLGFLVRRKLGAKGYLGNKFYSSVINDGRVEKLKEDYKKATGQDLVLIFKEEINGSNNS